MAGAATQPAGAHGRFGVIAGLVIVAALLACGLALRLSMRGGGTSGGGRTIHVSAGAASGGNGSDRQPFNHIERALIDAQPGNTVDVGPGTYHEAIRSIRSGLPGRPIRLVGHSARIDGGGANHVIDITNDDLELRGFDVRNGGSIVVIFGAHRVRLVGNRFHHAGTECVRLKYMATDNEVADNRVDDCGLKNFDVASGLKNGEGIYIGTSPEQLDRNPTDVPDASSGNIVRHNTIRSRAECVDLKEGTFGNLVEGNRCTGTQDPDSAGLSSRGHANIFRDNVSSHNAGAGVRLGGDPAGQNQIRNNRLDDNRGYGVKVVTSSQGPMCGNDLSGNKRGAANIAIDPGANCGT